MAVALNSPSLASAPALVPRMLNHYARVTHDVGTTADFYGRILGMEIASTIMDDHIPSTGDPYPYFHIFFRMADGSTMAFFECTELPLPSAPSHPAYDVFEHIALQVNDRAELIRWKEWLISQGVEILGPVDHKGMIESIYFHDPNGYRLELTTPLDPEWNNHGKQARIDLALWLEARDTARAMGENVGQAMVALIQRVKQQRYQSGS